MIGKNAFRIGFVAIALITTLLSCGHPAFGQDLEAKEPIMGTWKLDPARSALKRGGPSTPVRAIRPAAWVFAPEVDGFRMSEYDGETPTGTPTLSYFAKFDGKEYPHPGGRDKGETVTHWRVSPYLMVRLAKVNDKSTEWVIYAVSSDGKVLTSTSWNPETPEYHNVRVFDREK